MSDHFKVGDRVSCPYGYHGAVTKVGQRHIRVLVDNDPLGGAAKSYDYDPAKLWRERKPLPKPLAYVALAPMMLAAAPIVAGQAVLSWLGGLSERTKGFLIALAVVAAVALPVVGTGRNWFGAETRGHGPPIGHDRAGHVITYQADPGCSGLADC